MWPHKVRFSAKGALLTAGRPATVLAVSSPGGVLVDTLALTRAMGPTRWAAVPAVDTRARLDGHDVIWMDEVEADRPVSRVRGLWHAWRDLRRRPPEVLVSAGTGLAVPWFLAARMLGIRTIWIETWNLVGREQGLAASICSRLADSVAVQRPERLLVHRRSVLVGELY